MSDAGDSVADRDTGQVGAAFERTAFDVGDVVGYHHAGQAVTKLKRISSDVGDTAGNRVAAGFAHRVLDERGLALVDQYPIHAAKDGVIGIYRDCHQAGTEIERRISDVGDAVGNRETGQADAAYERTTSDTGDRVAIGRVWNGHCAASTSVSSDGNRTAIGCESELGMHHGGKRQQHGQGEEFDILFIHNFSRYFNSPPNVIHPCRRAITNHAAAR